MDRFGSDFSKPIKPNRPIYNSSILKMIQRLRPYLSKPTKPFRSFSFFPHSPLTLPSFSINLISLFLSLVFPCFSLCSKSNPNLITNHKDSLSLLDCLSLPWFFSFPLSSKPLLFTYGPPHNSLCTMSRGEKDWRPWMLCMLSSVRRTLLG